MVKRNLNIEPKLYFSNYERSAWKSKNKYLSLANPLFIFRYVEWKYRREVILIHSHITLALHIRL